MTSRVLEWLRLDERPEPPPGAGPDLRIFRASRLYLRYLFLGWGLKQAGALLGILVSLAYFSGWDLPFGDLDPFRGWLDDAEFRLGPLEVDLALWIHRLEILALATFAVQAAVSAWWLWLRWRMHWYMVGDEMMRIREGLWQVREQTFTLSKIQNMTVHQNLLQKLFGIGDLEVHTAGGGGKTTDDEGEEGTLHVGWFRGMDDPWALRDALRAGLSRYAGAGLGDADDRLVDHPTPDIDAAEPIATDATAGPAALVQAARELRDEARRLRRVATSGAVATESIRKA